MTKYRIYTLGLAITLCASSSAKAGYFELSANGSYFKQSNGLTVGELSYSTNQRMGVGFAYRFMTNTSIELTYSNAKNMDHYGYDQNFSVGSGGTATLHSVLNHRTEYNNLSLNLILDFGDKKSTFRPYVEGGGGLMTRKETLSGTTIESSNPVAVAQPVLQTHPQVNSVSANGGLGFKIFVADSIAIDIAGTVYATDLDKPEILIHYSFTGGLRFLF